MVGSVYEFNNYKATDFEPLFHPRSKFTDDTVCTIAVADGLLNKKSATDALREWGHRYWSNGGWGQRFAYWLAADDPQPYGSFGNGSAMRISSVAWLVNGTITPSYGITDNLTLVQPTNTTTVATVRITGGNVGTKYKIGCRITTADGLVYERSIFLTIREQ